MIQPEIKKFIKDFKYEYLTNIDLGYKPSPVEKAKFEYSTLGQVFNKALDSNERQEGLLKRLKNIEDKTDNNQLRAIEDRNNQSGIKSIGFDFKKLLSPEGLKAYDEIVQKEKNIDYSYLRMKTTSSKRNYDFKMFSKLRPFFERIYFGDILVPATGREQIAFDGKLENFKKYRPRTDVNIEEKKSL